MPNQSEAVDLVFQALADPTRRAVVERLSRGPASVSELAEPLDMALPSFLQHLQILEESGLVSSRKVGRVRTCRIEKKGISLIERWVSARRAHWESRYDALGAYLKETGKD